MQINRLFEIVYRLLDQKTVTAKDLAAHFEVSERTIYRDIEKLSEAGVPIYTEQGRGGGISILDQFVLNKAMLSEEEQTQILLALKSMTAAEDLNTNATLSKLHAFFQKDDINWIEVDFTRWGSSDADKKTFQTLQTAIRSHLAVQFHYYASDGSSSNRAVYPLKLVFKARAWYLQGYCLKRRDDRVFKICRMDDIVLTEQLFQPEQYPVPLLEPEQFDMPDLIDCKIRFSHTVAYRLFDEFDPATVEKQNDGCYLVQAKLPHDNWFYDYILSFGEHAELLEPEEARDYLEKKLKKLQALYKT